jgi:hypothetical protein
VAANDALLLEVARCPNVRRCYETTVIPHPCSKVVAAQRVAFDDFQLPEPWNGAIETAPILFVSWNPSLNPNETFPRPEWADEAIIGFFRTRFDHSDQHSQTWREMRGIASHLLGRDPKPGVDYAVTDAVRCKSRKGEGATQALGECSSRYLRRTLETSGARVFVALGKDARKTMASYFGVAAELGSASSPIMLGGCERILVQLGAPGAAESRRLGEEERLRVQSFLAS